jgi:hypothetical protein
MGVGLTNKTRLPWVLTKYRSGNTKGGITMLVNTAQGAPALGREFGVRQVKNVRIRNQSAAQLVHFDVVQVDRSGLASIQGSNYQGNQCGTALDHDDRGFPRSDQEGHTLNWISHPEHRISEIVVFLRTLP